MFEQRALILRIELTGTEQKGQGRLSFFHEALDCVFGPVVRLAIQPRVLETYPVILAAC